MGIPTIPGLTTQRTYKKPIPAMKKYQPTGKPTARQIIRETAAANNWRRISNEYVDYYTRDAVTVFIGWRKDDPNRFCTGSSRAVGGIFTHRDYTPKKVVNCRHWLRWPTTKVAA